MAEIIMGIDHGNGNMKGAHVNFPCGLVRYTSEPGRFTELVYAWLHKENAPVSSYNNANVSVEELKQQLLQDTDFIQQIKKSVVVEEDAGKVIEEEQSDGLDMDEGMLMAGLSMFESGF